MSVKKEKQEELNCHDGQCEVPEKDGVEVNFENKMVDRLMYFGDPMCSWCWGIADHLDALREKFEDQLPFEIVLGGLRPGGGEEWTHEFREMIRSHWEHVHEASGQPFDYTFLDRKSFNYDTEPPARAVRVVRDLAPEKEWAFFKALQRYFYAENKDITDIKILGQACESLQIDFTAFTTLFESEGYKQLVNQDFMKAQTMGVRGFPSVLVCVNGQYFAISMGYSDFEKMQQTLGLVLSESGLH